MLLDLTEVKTYLRVDGDEEDELITHFILVSTQLVEGVLRVSLSEFEIVPDIVKQAILFCVANLYEQRETLDMKDMLVTVKNLLFIHRNESW